MSTLARLKAAGRSLAVAALAGGALAVAPADAATGPAVGQPAPAFTATDSQGHTQSLADYRGKVVVLEWTNHDCPYVGKQYRSGNMQALQKQAAANGVVWLSVISSAPGEQGYVSGDQANRLTTERNAAPAAVLLDPAGNLGRAYNAKTTPHMYIVAPDGTLVYMGAIDDQPNTSGDPAKARNYVSEALQAVAAGKPVAAPSTAAYGCSVKYGS